MPAEPSAQGLSQVCAQLTKLPPLVVVIPPLGPSPAPPHTYLSLGDCPPTPQPTSPSPLGAVAHVSLFPEIHLDPPRGCTPWHPSGPGSRTLSRRVCLHLVHFRLLRRAPHQTETNRIPQPDQGRGGRGRLNPSGMGSGQGDAG